MKKEKSIKRAREIKDLKEILSQFELDHEQHYDLDGTIWEPRKENEAITIT